MKNSQLVLERSTNTHVLESKSEIIDSVDLGEGTMVVTTANPGSYVTHGEHGTLTVESPKFIKYNQKEVNPVTKQIMNAID